MMVGEKILQMLRQHAEGLSSFDLAAAIYNETDYSARGRVNQIIQNLRRKGYVIHMCITFTGERRIGKYILKNERSGEPSTRIAIVDRRRGKE
jgi:hypothetical protein